MTINYTYLYLLSPLHTGGTTQEGNLLGIARESHTNFPYIPSSSIRGRLRASVDDKDQKFKLFGTDLENASQAVELYTYLATWGMMRLKAEEQALSQKGKQDVVKKYFECLQLLSSVKDLASNRGLDSLKQLKADDYLGLTGLGLNLAQEFSFWANAIYSDVKGDA